MREGGYGFHRIWKNIDRFLQKVDVEAFEVMLAPGAGVRLKLTLDRYANRPKMTHPWHRLARLGEGG